jgi:hypothetical protein
MDALTIAARLGNGDPIKNKSHDIYRVWRFVQMSEARRAAWLRNRMR